MDASVLFSPANPIADMGKPQTLPSPSMQDVARFENILNQNAPPMADISNTQANSGTLLQLTNPASNNTADFNQAAIKTIESLDNSYHSMLDRFGTMPSFSSFVSDKSISADSNSMRTYPEVATGQTNSLQQSSHQHTQDAKSYMTAALEYNGALTKWGMNASIWMSKFSLISSAVNQVSQGFKTLFRTGG